MYEPQNIYMMQLTTDDRYATLWWTRWLLSSSPRTNHRMEMVPTCSDQPRKWPHLTRAQAKTTSLMLPKFHQFQPSWECYLSLNLVTLSIIIPTMFIQLGIGQHISIISSSASIGCTLILTAVRLNGSTPTPQGKCTLIQWRRQLREGVIVPVQHLKQLGTCTAHRRVRHLSLLRCQIWNKVQCMKPLILSLTILMTSAGGGPVSSVYHGGSMTLTLLMHRPFRL